MLSLGSRGAIGRSAKELVEVIPPRIEALCPIGAGDALAAAFTWAMDKKKEFVDAVRWVSLPVRPPLSSGNYVRESRSDERIVFPGRRSLDRLDNSTAVNSTDIESSTETAPITR